MKTVGRIMDVIESVEGVICQVLVIALIAVVFLQVLARFVFHWEVLWTLETAILCFVWTIMLGASIAVRRGLHFTIDIFPKTQWFIRFFGYAGILILSLVFAWFGTLFAIAEWKRFSHPSMVRITFFVACIPAMGITSTLFVLEKILNELLTFKPRLSHSTRENSEKQETI